METSTSPQIEGTVGRWTKLEHENFLKGLREYGKDWKRIGALIQTRTVVQVRTHAQKYFLASSKKSNKEHTSSSSAGKSNASPANETLVSAKKSQSANKRSHSVSPPLSKRTKHVPAVEEEEDEDDGMSATLTATTSAVSPTMGPERTDSLKLSFLVCLDMLPPLVDSYSPTSGSEGGTSPKSFIGHGESLLFSNSPSLSLDDDDDDNASNDNRHRGEEANMASIQQVNNAAQQHHLMAHVDDAETLTHTTLPVSSMENSILATTITAATAASAVVPSTSACGMDGMDAFNIGDLFPKWIETNNLLLDDDHPNHLDLS